MSWHVFAFVYCGWEKRMQSFLWILRQSRQRKSRWKSFQDSSFDLHPSIGLTLQWVNPHQRSPQRRNDEAWQQTISWFLSKCKVFSKVAKLLYQHLCCFNKTKFQTFIILLKCHPSLNECYKINFLFYNISSTSFLGSISVSEFPINLLSFWVNLKPYFKAMETETHTIHLPS